MSEVNTSALRGSLEKCFAEQHAINNGSFEQWCFDQQQNDLKQLTGSIRGFGRQGGIGRMFLHSVGWQSGREQV